MILDALFDEPTVRKPIDKRIKKMTYYNQKGKCNYCAKKLELAYMHLDHRTPWARNGSDNPPNLQILCGPCNTRKGDLTDGEFRRRYKLPPIKQANGPPSKVIPQKYFEGISQTLKIKKAASKRRSDDDWWW